MLISDQRYTNKLGKKAFQTYHPSDTLSKFFLFYFFFFFHKLLKIQLLAYQNLEQMFSSILYTLVNMMMTNYFSFLSETMSQVRVLALCSNRRIITQQQTYHYVATDLSLRGNRPIITQQQTYHLWNIIILTVRVKLIIPIFQTTCKKVKYCKFPLRYHRKILLWYSAVMLREQ